MKEVAPTAKADGYWSELVVLWYDLDDQHGKFSSRLRLTVRAVVDRWEVWDEQHTWLWWAHASC